MVDVSNVADITLLLAIKKVIPSNRIIYSIRFVGFDKDTVTLTSC